MTTIPVTPVEISNEVYRTVEQLRLLSPDELAALWDAIPTDRQTFYQKAYDRQIHDAGAQSSDKSELLVIADLLQRYEIKFTIPVSEGYWTGVPATVRQAAQAGVPLLGTENSRAAVSKPNPLILIGFGIGVVIFLFSFLSHSTSQSHPSLAVSPTAITTLGGTPLSTATPTALALEAQDSVIKAGDLAQDPANNPYSTDLNSRLIVYPVSLRVFAVGDSNPRVFVVQNRKISTTEWNFDPNPDTASYVAGLSIRQVVGIPWSDSNQQLFDQLTAGARFELQMNTGSTLIFSFASKELIIRSDTQSLRQTTSGLVLLLIGQRDDTGAETATRVQVETSYLSDQEIASDGLLTFHSLVGPTAQSPTATLSPTPYEHLQVDLVSVTSSPGSGSGAGSVAVRLHMVNEENAPVAIGPNMLWMSFGYSPGPLEPRIPSEGLTPFQLLPNQAVDLTLYFPWTGEPQASLGVNDDYRYQIRMPGGG